MEKSHLSEYVAKRIGAGVPKSEIREELLSVGWSEEESDAAYRDGVVSLGVPLPGEGARPMTGKKSSTVDIIINLFSFILLGIVATAAGVLYFQVINRYFPDRLVAVDYRDEQALSGVMHYAIAALLIGYPLYLGTMRLWFRKFREDGGRIESRLSRWLTYVVLLAASVTIVGDLITLVFTFLQGELTARFFLKALTILTIASGIFGFYFFERRRVQYRKEVPEKTFRSFATTVSVIVGLGVVMGFFAGESPETTRNRTFDARRAEDLRSLSGCIEQYAADFGDLPVSVSELVRSSRYTYCASFVSDPETGEEYSYRVVTPSREQGATRIGEYEFCATFALETPPTAATTPFGTRSDVWSIHVAGRECDTVTAQLGELAPMSVPMEVR